MRRILIMAASVLLVLAGSDVGSAGSQPSPQAVPIPPKLTIVSTVVKKPDRHVVKHVRFVPWAQPSRGQVDTIVAVESALWGAPASRLHHRIACESTYQWWVSNGQYVGLGQFGSNAFGRGMGSIKSRRVRLVRTHYSIRRALVTRRYSDGSVRRWRGKHYRVRSDRVQVGTIPKHPPRTHGWAQVRIMAQAIVGRSAVSNAEWDPQCR